MRERGLDVDYSTVFRRVQRYAPETNKPESSHRGGMLHALPYFKSIVATEPLFGIGT